MTPTTIQEYKDQLHSGASASVENQVHDFLMGAAAIQEGGELGFESAGLSFEGIMTNVESGVDGLHKLVTDCGVHTSLANECVETIMHQMDRFGKGGKSAGIQFRRRPAEGLTSMEHSEIYGAGYLASIENAASMESFGANMDLLIPDLKNTIASTITMFKQRLHFLNYRPTSQPNATYTKTDIAIFNPNTTGDLATETNYLEILRNPALVTTELQRIIPRKANDGDNKYLYADGIIKPGVEVNMWDLAVEANTTHDKFNRTDLIADKPVFKTVVVQLVDGENTEVFHLNIPAAGANLTRLAQNTHSGDRGAQIATNVLLKKGTPKVDNTASTILAAMDDNEALKFRVIANPRMNLRYASASCTYSVSFIGPVNTADGDADISDAANAIDPAITNLGWTIDSRYKEGNLRQSNLNLETKTQSFSVDIPVSRNVACDYEIGQKNNDDIPKIITNLLGIGQDNVNLDVCITAINDVNDDVEAAQGDAVELRAIRARYVGCAKCEPAVYIGSIDFANLNVLQSSNLSGDIKQKALTHLNAVTTQLMSDSLVYTHLGADKVKFKVITSIAIAGGILNQPHIYQHLNKMVDPSAAIASIPLPNGSVVEICCSPFNEVADKMVVLHFAPDANSDLSFGHLWDFGPMVAHYTPSGDAASHKLFGNIRELPYVTCPIGGIIDVKNLDQVNGINLDTFVRPTVVQISAE